MTRLLPALLGAALAVLALHLLGWGPRSSVPTFPAVIVDSAQVVRGEPTASPGLVERVVRPVAKAEVRATAPGAAAGDVLAFCASAGWNPPGAPAPVPEDTTHSPVPASALPTPPSGIPPALHVPAVSLIRSAAIEWRTTDVWGVSSSGALWRSTHHARPPVSIRAVGDSVIVQGSRLWWVRPVGSVALCAGGGWLGAETGSVVPVAVGCTLGAAVAVR